MRRTWLLLGFAVLCLPAYAHAATWYVDASVVSSGDGTSWETAFKTIQEGIDAASHAETVVVGQGLYAGVRFQGKNVTVLSTNPFDPSVVRDTVMDGLGWTVVVFAGTEDETSVLSGFTIRGGAHGIYGNGTHAAIENCVITDNWHDKIGGGAVECDGLIENCVISYNAAGPSQPFGLPGEGGALYECHGHIRNCTIVHNWAIGVWEYDPDELLIWVEGLGGALFGCEATVENCIIWENSEPQVYGSREPVYSSVGLNPGLVDETNSDFRLTPGSPCIDAGFNDPDLPETDIAGMHRIMFGGKSLTVDMGAYEFYINKLDPVPGTNEATFTWSSLEGKTYSLFYTDDLLNWQTAIANFPSSGNETTSWIDDGSATGVPPSLAPRRFYRTLDKPQ